MRNYRIHCLRLILFVVVNHLTGDAGICSTEPKQSRPIVFAARLFDGQSQGHFHLYRINPDGTNQTQITSGSTDDINPVWSPDGKWIAFQRASNSYTVDCALCVLNLSTGKIVELCNSIWQEYRPDYFWESNPLRLVSPADGDHDCAAFTWSGNGFHAVALDHPYVENANATWRDYASPYSPVIIERKIGDAWQTDKSLTFDPDLFLGAAWIESNKLAWHGSMSVDGAESLFVANTSSGKPIVDDYQQIDVGGRISKLAGYTSEIDEILPWHGHPNDVIFIYNNTDSGDDVTLDLVDVPIGSQPARVLTTAVESVAQSPNGSYFAVTTEAKEVAVSKAQTVYTSPLYVVDTQTGKRRMITAATSRVYSADWRLGN